MTAGFWGFCLCFAGLNGAIAVGMGAGAAHALQSPMDTKALGWITTGYTFQLFHALALFGVSLLIKEWDTPSKLLSLSAILLMLGLLLFSGGLYLIAFTGNTSFATMAPFGGGSFILGWLCLGIHGLRSMRRREP